MKLILASASPRRREILRDAGLPYQICFVTLDERRLAAESAEEYVRRLAQEKAKAVAIGNCGRVESEPCLIIGADTTVIAPNGEILGKPNDKGDARRMLQLLSGRTHEVLTGIAVLRMPDEAQEAGVELTRVTFLPLSEADIDDYLRHSEAMDKAGAYGIQGIGGRFVSRIEGDYFNVVGLPLSKTWQMLRSLGWQEERHEQA